MIQTSYDIVKAHGGELKVEPEIKSNVGTGDSFTALIINLPFNEK